MRRSFVACLSLAICLVAIPVRSETYRHAGPPFSIDYPDGWKILPGEGGLATRASGPGGAMNVSVAASSRSDFDADRFTDEQLLEIADRLAASVARALRDFELVERGLAQLGGKRAAYFRWRALAETDGGSVETTGYYVATAHRGLVYSVTGVTQAQAARRTHPLIVKSIQSFRFLDASAPASAAQP